MYINDYKDEGKDKKDSDLPMLYIGSKLDVCYITFVMSLQHTTVDKFDQMFEQSINIEPMSYAHRGDFIS